MMRTYISFFGHRVSAIKVKLAAMIILVMMTNCLCQRVSSAPKTHQTKFQDHGPGDHERTLLVGKKKRYYSIHVPPSYDKSRPTPVVLNFHGGGGNSKLQRNASQMDSVSDRKGFITVYPQGTNKKFKLYAGYTWNAGTCCGWAKKNNIDDVAYTAALLDDLSKILNVDGKRVYATGVSNGAMMCYRLACELSDRIAAIAPVSGPMQMLQCKPKRPVPIIHFHGTKDEFVPMAGGKGPRSFRGQFFSSVKDTLQIWLRINGLDREKPKIIRKGDAIVERYGPTKNGMEVVLWKLEGAGHTWPGGKFGLIGEKTLGKMNTDINASEIMWEFFQKHPLDEK